MAGKGNRSKIRKLLNDYKIFSAFLTFLLGFEIIQTMWQKIKTHKIKRKEVNVRWQRLI